MLLGALLHLKALELLASAASQAYQIEVYGVDQTEMMCCRLSIPPVGPFLKHSVESFRCFFFFFPLSS